MSNRDPFDDDVFDDHLDADALAEQREVRALLSSLPDPGPVPPDVVDRITRTLRTLQEQDAGRTPAAGASVVPITPRRPQHRPLWLAAAAAVVLAGGGAVVSQLASDTSATSTSASVAGSSASPERTSGDGARGVAPDTSGRVYASGTPYRRADLVRQAAALLAPSPPPAAERPGAAGLLMDSTALSACLRAVGAAAGSLLAADLGTYEGRPAVVLVVTGRSGREVVVADQDCRPGAATRLASAPMP
ncbi:MAG TPA: hypothetical protein VKB14_12465 [Actinomycetales bacterium]|nr:hypothetical protein [Actinomycetales bacterium]